MINILNFNTNKNNKIKNIFFKRYKIIFISIIFFLLILLLRMIFLQFVFQKTLIHESNLRSIRKKDIFIYRGKINDRFGTPLALNITVYSICANPKEIIKNEFLIKYNDIWKKLAEILNIKLDTIEKKINSSKNKNFIYLARQIKKENINLIENLKINGIYFKKETKRFYTSGEVSSHLVGLTNIDGYGIEGVEKSFNDLLSGKNGIRIIRKDLKGNTIENIKYKNEESSHDINLSIDLNLQNIVYKTLSNAVLTHKAESGSAILVNIHTGEILAMANSPSYDPNNGILIYKNMRNIAITDIFEPGSTIKPIVVMTALEAGIVHKNSVLNTLPFFINKHKIVDVNTNAKLSLTQILQKSSNVGVSKLSLSMPIEKLLHNYSLFGLCKSTNLGLIGENNGFYPKKKWSELERATISFGYGLMVTPLQLVKAYTIIGSYGIDRPLSIIKNNNDIYGKRVFSEKISQEVINMMEIMPNKKNLKLKKFVKNYKMSIKTGTVKKIGKQGKYINKYISYAVGVVPSNHPDLSLIIMINDPKSGKYYGREVSFPVFVNIINQILTSINN